MNKDKIKKLLKSRVLSVAASFCFAVYNGYLWFAKGYVFGGCICIYYFLLTLIRAAVIVLKSGEDKKKPEITESAPVSAVPAADDAALVAAITAAVSAYRVAHGESAGGFRVVSFKKRK